MILLHLLRFLSSFVGTLQAATSCSGSGLKGNRLIHLLCKFHVCSLTLVSYAKLNSLKLLISKLLMCNLGHFSKIQSLMVEAKFHTYTNSLNSRASTVANQLNYLPFYIGLCYIDHIR